MTLPWLRLLGCALCLSVAAEPAFPQQLSADLYAGGTRYGALGAQAAADAAAAVAALRLEAPFISAFAAAAAPLGSESPAWAVLGTLFHVTRPFGSFEIGADAGGDAFTYRQPDDRSGTGATLRVQPLVAYSHGRLRVQLHAARNDYVISEPDTSVQRHLYEFGGTAARTFGRGRLQLEALALSGYGSVWPFAGVQGAATAASLTLWGAAGYWFGDISEAVWQAGASIPVWRGEVWTSFQQTAFDPLFLGPERRTWNVGVTVPLRRSRRLARQQPGPSVSDGQVILRLARTGMAERGPVAVAGDFNQWQPVLMQAAGDHWQLSIPAEAGVIRFAFVDAAGVWFVPEDYPGRISDDMGGYVAVMVVP